MGVMTTDEPKRPRATAADFPVHWPVTTRWSDNDMFGHLNNAVYYELFDTAINGWLEQRLSIDPTTAESIPVVAESSCRYLSELAFPDPLVVGVAVERIGRSSVVYRLGMFSARDGSDLDPAQLAAAEGRWAHVYIDAKTRATVEIPADIRSTLVPLKVKAGGTQ